MATIPRDKICLILSICVLILMPYMSSSETCDMDSTEPQCSNLHICIENECIESTNCEYTVLSSSLTDKGQSCGNVTELHCSTHWRHNHNGGPEYNYCRSGFCQRKTCTTTGQCAHGQICSPRRGYCVWQEKYKRREGTRSITLPLSNTRCYSSNTRIDWFKGDPDTIVARLPNPPAHPSNFGEYCESTTRSCPVEYTRGFIDRNTGGLKIMNLDSRDTDYYYYNFWPNDTGHKYEIYLEVEPYFKPNNPKLEHFVVPSSDSNSVVGYMITWTCTIERIRPEAEDIYWKLGNLRFNGETTTKENSGNDNSVKQTNSFTHYFTKNDEDTTLQCIVVTTYGEQVSTQTIIDFWPDSAGVKSHISFAIIIGVLILALIW